MADAKKCDRCGKLFEPYNGAGYEAQSMYTNILVKNISLAKKTYKESGEYDLCKECNDSFSKWLSEPSVVNGNCSCFGEYDDEEYGCVSCSIEQECKTVSKKKDAPKCFGKFDGNDRDCILCGLANDCEGKANEQQSAT